MSRPYIIVEDFEEDSEGVGATQRPHNSDFPWRERSRPSRPDQSLSHVNNKRNLNVSQQLPAVRLIDDNDQSGGTADIHESSRGDRRRPIETEHDPNEAGRVKIVNEIVDSYPLNFFPRHDFQVMNLAAETQIDKTIHFAVNISDDIEGHCEELSRLKRWGHFSMALKYFEFNLQQHLDLPIVAIEYADLLSEQGCYKEVVRCRLNLLEDLKIVPSSFEPSDDLYKTHFELLLLKAKVAFQGLTPGDLNSYEPDAFLRAINRKVRSRFGEKNDSGRVVPFDYTEIQVLRNSLDFATRINKKYKRDVLALSLVSDEWQTIYNDMMVDDRIWEFRDLFIAMNGCLRPLETWESLFGTRSSKRENDSRFSAVIHRLNEDWDLNEYDESTELALLSILVGQIYEMIPWRPYAILPWVAREMKIFSQRASLCADRIKHHSAHLIKTRPYLQWRILTETLDRKLNCFSFQEDRDAETENMPGFLFETWPLPIYLPDASERTDWPKPDSRFPPNESLRWVLKICRDNGDYMTEALCLYELIARAEDPRLYFEELDNLFLQKQGDYRAYLHSCISQYHLITDEKSSRRLIEKITDANLQLASSCKEEVDTLRMDGLRVQIALSYLFPELWPDIRQNQKLLSKLRSLRIAFLDNQESEKEQVPEHDTEAQRDQYDITIHNDPASPSKRVKNSQTSTRPTENTIASRRKVYEDTSGGVNEKNARRSPSPHYDQELIMGRRLLERNDMRQDLGIGTQNKEIERLERRLESARDRILNSRRDETTRLPQMDPDRAEAAQDSPYRRKSQENSDVPLGYKFWKQQQIIERLERELERHKEGRREETARVSPIPHRRRVERSISIQEPDEPLGEVENAQATEKNNQDLNDQTQIEKEHQPRVSSDPDEASSTDNDEAEDQIVGREVARLQR
ncbi:hypothetical protein N7456_000600 [Penicillium angulare]|uniref:Uncharacterized protein n=1 Tax=Penicillium angulare TaxID=116970 RepID=A0A9W9KR31_9EURO|nr:hypothetical protein N7456_000600 [Penicillium angulare]